MIKDPTPHQLNSVKLNVLLKDGREFLGRDTTSQPFGENHNVVAIWDATSILIFPMSEVREIAMTFES
jgi:hypothetical protein